MNTDTQTYLLQWLQKHAPCRAAAALALSPGTHWQLHGGCLPSAAWHLLPTWLGFGAPGRCTVGPLFAGGWIAFLDAAAAE